jgi:hypothetical protein
MTVTGTVAGHDDVEVAQRVMRRVLTEVRVPSPWSCVHVELELDELPADAPAAGR